MTPAEVQTFIVAFLFLLGIGVAGVLWAQRKARVRAEKDGVPVEPTGRPATAAIFVAAIMFDFALAMVWVLLGRQNG